MTHAALNQRDLRIREHFNNHVDLYVDKELAVYRASCAERIELLWGAAGFNVDAALRVLDIGCGGGVFADMLLTAFPNARLVGIDTSHGMLNQNTPSNRKALSLGDARFLPFRDGGFDVINLDTVMHHLVDASGYHNTLAGICGFVSSLRGKLRPGGAVVVREIYHEYQLLENLGSRMLFEVSTLRLPSMAASLLSKAGVKTANAGVCFLTRRQWASAFEQCGFEIAGFQDRVWPGQPYRKAGFRQSGDVHYVLLPSRKPWLRPA
jgi:SAM-dependent methyltransferase